jgi:hypothetical protein
MSDTSKPKKPARPKRPKDQNQLAAEIVRLATGDDEAANAEESEEPDPVKAYLASIGRKGGLKGGKARAESLSARKRKAIAKKAAEARWKKKK